MGLVKGLKLDRSVFKHNLLRIAERQKGIDYRISRNQGHQTLHTDIDLSTQYLIRHTMNTAPERIPGKVTSNKYNFGLTS